LFDPVFDETAVELVGPDFRHGEDMFDKVYCNPRNAIDITDQVKEGFGTK
jgi:hypothetical protein